MKVNRNTIHYKLYDASFGHGAFPPERTNLCNYFWRAVGMAGVSVAIILTVLAFIAVVLSAIYHFPLEAVAIVVVCGVIYGGFLVYNRKIAGQEPGLVRSYLKAKKDKVCPFIEFES